MNLLKRLKYLLRGNRWKVFNENPKLNLNYNWTFSRIKIKGYENRLKNDLAVAVASSIYESKGGKICTINSTIHTNLRLISEQCKKYKKSLEKYLISVLSHETLHSAIRTCLKNGNQFEEHVINEWMLGCRDG